MLLKCKIVSLENVVILPSLHHCCFLAFKVEACVLDPVFSLSCRHFNEMTSHGTSHRDRTSSSPLPLGANRPISPGHGFTPPSPRMPRYPSNEKLSGSHSSASSSPPTQSVQVGFLPPKIISLERRLELFQLNHDTMNSKPPSLFKRLCRGQVAIIIDLTNPLHVKSSVALLTLRKLALLCKTKL